MKCCDYNAGMMREPVTFQRRTRSADGAGSWSETWATISGTPSRGNVTQTSGREAVLHGRKEAHAAVKIVVRYCSTAIREADRVQIRSINYNVLSVNNIEFRNQWLEIIAERGVPA